MGAISSKGRPNGLKSRSMGLIAVNVVFREVTGKGSVSADGTVSGGVTIAAASIDIKNTRRDEHLRSADFFGSDDSPDITLTANSIRPSSGGAASGGAASGGYFLGAMSMNRVITVHAVFIR
jgi:polyisoprenoid-binding protein YceI